MPSPNSGLVTRTVPKVTGGVSQRSPVVRDPSQCTELINIIPDTTLGMIRRPASQFAAVLTEFNADHYLYTFQFSATEKYALLVKNGALKVVDLVNKNEMTVNVLDGSGTYLTSADPTKDFQALTIGNETLILNRSITVAQDEITVSPTDAPVGLVWVRLGDQATNYTITLDGTNYSVTTSASLRDEIDTRNIAAALRLQIPHGVFRADIKPSGVFEVNDTWTLGDSAHSKSSSFHFFPRLLPPGLILEDVIPQLEGIALLDPTGIYGTLGPYVDGKLAYPIITMGDTMMLEGIGSNTFTFTAVTNHGGIFTVTNYGLLADTYEVTQIGSSLAIKKKDGIGGFVDFTFGVSDGLGSQALESFKGTAQKFADLPLTAPDGMKIHIVGEMVSEVDDFYVEYQESSTPDQSGVWVESLKGGELTSLDPSTMPHVLVPDGAGGWNLQQAEWNPRAVGDLITNPMPSFVGSNIDDLFFFKNRLGLVSGENRTMSQSGQYFNMFRKTVAQLLDSERIDVASNSGQVNKINFATFQDHELILWGDEGQIAVTGSPLLTPKTVSEDPAGSFKTSPDVKPVASGKFTYFLTERTGTTQVSEYFSVDAAKPRKEVADLTENVPTYIDGVPTHLAASDANGMIFVGAKSETI